MRRILVAWSMAVWLCGAACAQYSVNGTVVHSGYDAPNESTPGDPRTVIPASYFGLHVNGGAAHWPPSNGFTSFGTLRLWDTGPTSGQATQWANVQTGDRAYDFSGLDLWLQLMKTQGSLVGGGRVILNLGRTPSTQNGLNLSPYSGDSGNTGGCGYNVSGQGPGQCFPPKDIVANQSCWGALPANNTCGDAADGPNLSWKRWVRGLANHINRLDPSVYETSRLTFEPWNEITASKQWYDRNKTGQLSRLTGDAARILHLANPRWVVTSPNTTNWDPSAISGTHGVTGNQATLMGIWGIWSTVNAISYHGYTNNDGIPEEVARIVDDPTYGMKALVAGAGSAYPMLNTEFGWGANATAFTDPDMQKAFVARSYLTQWASGVEVAVWYGWDVGGSGSSSQENLWDTDTAHGCTQARGSGYLCPAGIAYEQVYRWMVGNRMSQACAGPAIPRDGTATPSGVWTCGFTRPDGSQTLAVWDSSQTCAGGSCTTSSYSAGTQYSNYYTLDDATPHAISGGTMQIGAKPILLEQSLCGPPSYNCARTDFATVQLATPIPPAGPNTTVQAGQLVAGNFIGANTIVTDNLSNARIVRITDGGSDPTKANPTTCAPATAGSSFVANYSGNDTDQHVNADSTLLAIGRVAGGYHCIVPFNVTTMQAGTPLAYKVMSKQLSWDHSNPKVLYALEDNHILNKYDFSVDPNQPAVTTLYDFTAAGNCLAGALNGTIQYTSVFQSSADDQTFTFGASDTGGQDTGALVVSYRIGAGCRVYNTWNVTDAGIPPSTIIGDWGATGTPSFHNSANTLESFKLHEVFPFGDGNWTVVGGIGCTGVNDCSADPPYFWNVPTLNLIAASVGGHFCPGYRLFPHGSGTPAGQIETLTTANPPSGTNLIPAANLPDPGVQQSMHCSWNNTGSSDNLPLFASFSTAGNTTGVVAANGSASTPFAGPYNNEIVGYPTNNPSSAKLLRFGHNYASGLNPLFQSQFATGSVSTDGRIFVFTSDWMGGLGDAAGNNTCVLGGPDWTASGNYGIGNVITPAAGNRGNYTFHASACTGSCTSGANKMGTVVAGTTGSNASGTAFSFAGTFVAGKFPVGAWARVTACSVSGYNGDWPISASSTSNVTVAGGSSGLGPATGCQLTAEWPQTASGSYVDNQVTWTADGAQSCRSDVFVMELR